MPVTITGTASCGKCVYFEAEGGANLGLCRYNPPISQPSSSEHGVWPKVETNDWCGHFEGKVSA
jgi:hypothetical protein